MKLPPEKKYVLIHVPNMPWIDENDQVGVFFKVARLVKGISQEERKALSDNDPRKKSFHAEDEWGNNKFPYIWEEFGGHTYWGHEVKAWSDLPRK